MKHVLRGLGVMMLLWSIVYVIGLTVTGLSVPSEWPDKFGLVLGMALGVVIGFWTGAISAIHYND